MQVQAIATHQHIFTDYVRLLNTADGEPAPELIEEVLLCLWRALRLELRKRGLWDRPPSYLGIYGLTSWDQATVGRAERLDTDLGEGWELVIDCFRYIFIDRFRYLVRQLQAKPDIDGLIFRNIKNFLHDTQKKHDPLGFRVFALLHTAVMEEVRSGVMKVLEGDLRVRNATLLGFSDRVTSVGTADLADLANIVRVWNNVLLPDLITARGKEQDQVVATLRSLLLDLPAQGAHAFRFGDLLEPLKIDLRGRWSSLFDVAEGETAVEQGDDELSSIVRLIGPDVSFDEKDAFDKLVSCVTQSMKDLDETPTTRRYLKRLWSFLKTYAADPEDQSAARGHETTALELATTKRLSRRKLAEVLGLPRNRMADLFATLGTIVDGCRNVLGRPPGPSTTTGTLMAAPTRDRTAVIEALSQGVAEARRQASTQVSELRAEPHRPPELGDLYLLDRTVNLGLEWAILRQDPHGPNRFLAVPADPDPLSGSTDVTVPGEASSGPLTLRCGHAVWLDVAELDSERRTGRLEPSFLQQAQDKRHRLEAGTLVGSELEQEVDIDPEYRQWIDEILKPAVALAKGSSRGDAFTGEVVAFASPKRRGWSSRAFGLAASILLVVTLGLSGALTWQQQRLRSTGRELADLEQQLSSVQQEKGRLEKAHTELMENKERAEQEYGERITALEAQIASPRGRDIQVNPPLVTFFAEDGVRATTKSVEISPGDRMFNLIIAVEETATRYRLHIARQDAENEPIWTRDALEPNKLSEIVLLVPTELVSAGSYLFRLEKLVEGRAVIVGEYALVVELAP